MTGDIVSAGPKPPSSIEATGLDDVFLIDLLTKTVDAMGLDRPSEMAQAMKLPRWILDQLLEMALEMKLFYAVGQLGANLNAEMRYAITERGRARASEAFDKNQWIGPAPVPLHQFVDQVKNQSIKGETLTREMLENAFADLTLSEGVMQQLGPAANSGQSIMLFGPPGNGKSTIAEHFCHAYHQGVYIPHALEVDNQIITLYDPTVHIAIDDAPHGDGVLRRSHSGHDQRYVLCRRPAVITGGELTLEKLDLSYSSSARIYEAPYQLKACGGVFVVDDFGRQRHKPQEFVNRLIVPLENRVDYLSLSTGRKFEVPFDTLVIFSTNIAPEELLDTAGLRRIRFKIPIMPPDRNQFIRIFARTAQRNGMTLDEDTLAYVLFELYGKTANAAFHAFHPRFLVEQSLAICAYEGVEPQLKPEFLKRAWAHMVTQTAH
ncbi:ATPase [Limibaculum sp. M0105]|uniref:ATPase n=1 Tax=Thermohalobaculum xanthum TaxID=2753746 RepID=A0A8J7M508_9RHOB|nr:ATPase [Thermohalobaculum xanthum]MBK0398444.1 ATPase [Thermohalobaculum xanthum]